MKTEFVCKLNGQTFTSKEEALRYMENQYLEEVEAVDGLGGVEEKFRSAFPNYRFRLFKENHSDPNYEFERFNEDNPDSNIEIIHVEMISNTIKSTFSFSIAPKEKYGYPGYDEFETVEDAISFHMTFLSGADKFGLAVLEEIKKYDPNVTGYNIEGTEQSHGTGDSFYTYEVNFVNDKNQKVDWHALSLDYSLRETLTYEPNHIENEIQRYIPGIKGSYVTELEGAVTTGYSKYSNDHHSWYVVDGVAIDTLARRAMDKNLKLRVQIVKK